MDTVENPSAEELQAESEAKKVPTVEEISAKLAEELELDPEADKERLDKLAKREYDQRVITSKAIEAKIKHRSDLAEFRKNNPPKPKEDTEVVPPKQSDLSPTDIIALAKMDLPEEDIEEVRQYASFKKISVLAALKDSTMVKILEGKDEVRRTANATQTGRQNRGSQAPTGEDLLAGQEQGTGKNLETTEEMQSLWTARQGRKIRKH